MNRYRYIALLGICLLMINLVSGCSNANTLDSQSSKLVDRIIYFTDADRGSQVNVMTPDGSPLAPIQFNLPAGIKIGGLQWSKSTQQWAFAGVGSGPTDIYVASADGKTVKNITNSAGIVNAESPAFSPDGKRIAYTTAEGSRNTAVTTSDVDGKNIQRISKLAIVEGAPTWLPDNSHLLMFSSEQGSPNIYKAALDGSPLVNLSKGPGQDTDLSLAENGLIFVFTSDRERGRNLFAYEMSTGKITRLTKDLGTIYSGRISPDATKVVFRAEKDGASDLFLYDFASQSTTQLTHTPTIQQQDISWSADSQKILFAADENGQKDIFLMDLSGKITNLTKRPSNEYGARWIRMLP